VYAAIRIKKKSNLAVTELRASSIQLCVLLRAVGIYAVISSTGYFHMFEHAGDYSPETSFPVKMLTNVQSGERSYDGGAKQYFRFDFSANLMRKGGSFVFFVKPDDKATEWVKALKRLIPEHLPTVRL